MNRLLTTLLFFSLTLSGSIAQPIFRIDSLPEQGVLLDKGWKWHTGDNPDWAKPDFNDSGWDTLNPVQDMAQLRQLPQEGIGWMRIRLRVAPQLQGRGVGMHVRQVGASELFLNGELTRLSGKINSRKQVEVGIIDSHGPFVRLSNDSIQVIAIRYAFSRNRPLQKTLPFFSLLLLMPEGAEKGEIYREFYTSLAIALFSIFLVLGVLQLLLYVSATEQRATLYLGLFLVAQSVTHLTDWLQKNGELLSKTYEISDVAWWYDLNLIIFDVSIALSAFFYLLGIYEYFRQPKGLLFFMAAMISLATAPAGILLAGIYGYLALFVLGYILPWSEILRIGILALKQKRSGARLFTLAHSLLLGVFIVYTLTIFIPSFGVFLASYGINDLFTVSFLGLALTISLLLAQERAATNKLLQKQLVEVEVLSQKTISQEQEKQHLLATQNERLEQQVEVRTAELADKNRELVIEAALEKIRSRSLGMHRSDEIAQVVVVLFEKLNELGLEFDGGAGIHVFTEGLKDAALWVISPQQFPTRVSLPYSEDDFVDNPIISDVWQAKETGQPIVNKTYSFEQKNRYFQYVFKHNDNTIIPEIVRNFIWSVPSYTATFIAEQNSLLGINSWNGQLFSESDVKVLKKVARAFEQAYIRFLDLQKAEAQAQEAQVEVALERVRSRTMSMQNSNELAEIISVLYKEILNLGIHHEDMETCYITTFDEGKPIGEIYLTYSYGDLLPRSFQIRYDEDSLFKQIYTEWRNGNPFFIGHLEGNNLIQHFDFLFSNIPASIIEMRSSEPTQLPFETFTHALCFSQGYLAIVTRKAVPEYHEVFKRFGSALQQAYTRFLDLKKAEAQAVQSHLDLIQIQTEKKRAEDALTELRITQTQLIQKEKLASLGELTAGIAHEIQNPLNFVNNFSEVSTELVEELRDEEAKDDRDPELIGDLFDDLTQNLAKITQHGNRASNIVKGMLEHSRAGTGERQPTDLNALADEYLRLAYQGLRAKDKTFNCELKTDFDPGLGKVEVVPQEIGRVLLNLYNNAFYTVREKQKMAPPDYQPTISISTKRTDNRAEIRISDNGTGIPESVQAKIFQPFFTTKPTGEGTGLGLSLSYDIVTKGHGGTLCVDSHEGEGTEFVVSLPLS